MEGEERARREKEEALRRYELLAGNSRDIMLFVDLDSRRILEANSAAVSAYGYSREELLGLTIGDLRAHSTQQEIAAQIAEADDHGILFQTEHRRKDGTTFPVEVSSRGATIGDRRTLVSVIRDITERKLAEEALRESEQRLRLHLENTPMAVVEWDKDLRVIRWSGEAERMFGWTRGGDTRRPDGRPEHDRRGRRPERGAHDQAADRRRHSPRRVGQPQLHQGRPHPRMHLVQLRPPGRRGPDGLAHVARARRDRTQAGRGSAAGGLRARALPRRSGRDRGRGRQRRGGRRASSPVQPGLRRPHRAQPRGARGKEARRDLGPHAARVAGARDGVADRGRADPPAGAVREGVRAHGRFASARRAVRAAGVRRPRLTPAVPLVHHRHHRAQAGRRRRPCRAREDGVPAGGGARRL